MEETISAGEAIIKFETESAAFAAVGGHDNAANGKESKESEIKSRKKTDESQVEKQETGIEVATTETGAGNDVSGTVVLVDLDAYQCVVSLK